MEKSSFKFDEPWEQVKEYVKECNLLLTDEDLEYQEGQEDQLLERLAKKLDKTKEQVKDLIESAAHSRGIAG